MTKKEDLKRMNKTAKFIIAALVLYIIAILSFSGCNGKTEVIEIEKVDTVFRNDTIKYRDTIKIEKPVPKITEIIRIDTLYKENGDTVQLVTEHNVYKDTICKNQDSLIIQSFITGVNPTLDSMIVDWRKQEIIKTVEITKHVKKKGFTISPQIGIGYGLFNKKADMYVGIGLNYNF